MAFLLLHNYTDFIQQDILFKKSLIYLRIFVSSKPIFCLNILFQVVLWYKKCVIN